MDSCLYKGWVRHRRLRPQPHNFRYRLFLMYLDLAELDHLFDPYWLWSADKPGLARFRRRDHLGDPGIALDEAVRTHIERDTGQRPDGPIRLLTHLSYFGYRFNPVSFYYCFDRDDTHLVNIVTEVNNTPWDEQHVYVLDRRHNVGGTHHHRYRLDKQFHVSPFMPMALAYDWRFNTPGEHLNVHMESSDQQGKLFDATLTLTRTPICSSSLAGVLLGYPLITAKTVAAIYYQAARLWLKRTPLYTHPAKLPAHETVKES